VAAQCIWISIRFFHVKESVLPDSIILYHDVYIIGLKLYIFTVKIIKKHSYNNPHYCEYLL